MNFIRTSLSLLKPVFGVRCRSYAVPKGCAANKFNDNLLSVRNLPIKLINYRSADLSREHFITQDVLSRFEISENFVAVRVQEDKFTDLKNKTIQGHKSTVATVRDWYNPYQNQLGISMGKIKSSSDVANKECRSCMNVMLMEKGEFKNKILNNDNLLSQYGGGGNKSYVVASLKDFLDKGAKIYPDESSALRLGQPFIITLPETTKISVEIYPVRKK